MAVLSVVGETLCAPFLMGCVVPQALSVTLVVYMCRASCGCTVAQSIQIEGQLCWLRPFHNFGRSYVHLWSAVLVMLHYVCCHSVLYLTISAAFLCVNIQTMSRHSSCVILSAVQPLSGVVARGSATCTSGKCQWTASLLTVSLTRCI
jgi:hypothetical protein